MCWNITCASAVAGRLPRAARTEPEARMENSIPNVYFCHSRYVVAIRLADLAGFSERGGTVLYMCIHTLLGP